MSDAALIRPPSLGLRLKALFYHGGRITFLPWPRYTFQDLATCQDSLDGPAFQNVARRMAEDEIGKRLLEDRPTISLAAVDWARLSMLPIDTLGYNIWHHLYSNGILQDVDLGDLIVRWDDQTEYAKKRYRETHDLRHVMLGLGVEGYEEVVLQAFQFSQQPQLLSGGIVLLGGLKHAIGDKKWREIRTLVPQAYQTGKKVMFLSNIYFEELWEMPLVELRRQLGLTPIGDRYPVTARHPDAPWSLEKTLRTEMTV